MTAEENVKVTAIKGLVPSSKSCLNVSKFYRVRLEILDKANTMLGNKPCVATHYVHV